MTEITKQIKRKSIGLLYSEAPSQNVLEVVMTPMGENPSLSDVKTAIKRTAAFVDVEVFIESPNSPYDCTGKAFTSGLDRIKRSIEFGGHDGSKDQYMLVSLYDHRISIDV